MGNSLAALRILHLTETGSTNADAMRLALKGEELPLWVMADRQTAGRGRAGRTWTSPLGNFYASLACFCTAAVDKAGQLSLVAGISFIDAIRARTELAFDAELRLKWPNDILIGKAKAGGILIESTTARGSPGFLAMAGFGLNIISAPDDLARPVTALGRHGPAPSPAELLQDLAAQTSIWLERWDSGNNFAAIRDAWVERAGPFGEPISINTTQGPMSGTYQGLSESGALRIEIGGQLREFSHGDVALGGEPLYDGAL
jgi:BirA family biotin operon repressor/biotin-[acetyl-CoA-carboxylase] ligase